MKLRSLVFLLILFSFSSIEIFAQIKTVTLSSSGSVNIPAGVVNVDLKIWGAGGGGGGSTNKGGGGGGAGAYFTSLVAVPPGSSSYTIGAGGSGSQSNNGSNGGASSITFNSTVYTANGGSGGVAGGSSAGSGGTGGTGGTVGTTAGNGSAGVNSQGGNGGTNSAAGSGSAGSGTTTVTGGNGGIAAGGGGAVRVSSTNGTGGNGGNGQIILSYIPVVYEYYDANNNLTVSSAATIPFLENWKSFYISNNTKYVKFRVSLESGVTGSLPTPVVKKQIAGNPNVPYNWDASNGIITIATSDLKDGNNDVGVSVEFSSGSLLNRRILNFGAAALPVTLSSFTAKATTDNKVNLAWVTASEINNKGFRIERKAEGESKFNAIGFVASKAEGGNSQLDLAYSFKDITAPMGSNMYRLVQEDIDGKQTISDVKMVKLNGQSVVSVYPNPTNGAVTINRSNDGKKMNVQILDQMGRIISQYQNISDSSLRLNLPQSGIYQIKLMYPETGEQSIQRIVVQH